MVTSWVVIVLVMCCCQFYNAERKIAQGTRLGHNTMKSLYPFMARLVMDGKYKCGGSLISDRIIATSRHCIEPCPCVSSGLDWKHCENICLVKLRENSDNQADTETVHSIFKLHLPEKTGYDKENHNYTHFYKDVTDFALIELTESANTCQEHKSSRDCWPIEPLKLPDSSTRIRNGEEVRTLGWGATYYEDDSEYLKQLDLSINSTTKFPFLIETNVNADLGDTCAGDSGGPLLQRNKQTLQWVLIGTLLGGGVNCDDFKSFQDIKHDLTGDWNSVFPHLPWINAIIKGPDVRCKGGYPCLKEDQCKSAQDLRKRFENGDKDAKNELIGLICNRRERTFCCSAVANNPTNTVRPITRTPSWLPGKGDCGIKPKTRNGRALGGVNTKPAEFPFTALIGRTYNNEIRYSSGGTLINHWYVLTAAHVQVSPIYQGVTQISYVRLGEWSVKIDPDCVGNHCLEPVQDFEISPVKVTVHPGYKEISGRSPTVINDIALIKLPRPAILNQGVQIVCLPINPQEAARELGITNIGSGLIGKRGTAVGWGYTEYDPWASGTQGDFKTHNVANAVQHKLSIPVLSSSECSEKWKNKFIPEASHICPGGELGKGTCKGDGGGPLYYARYEDGTEPWYLLGVNSVGSRLCGSGKPRIFSRVESFIPWIKRQME